MASERRSLRALCAVAVAMLPWAGVSAGQPPIRLEVERDADAATTILVVGAADTPIHVRYALAVDGASRVRQSGAARLRPGERAVVARVRIDGNAPWHAELEVTPEGAAPYVLTASGER